MNTGIKQIVPTLTALIDRMEKDVQEPVPADLGEQPTAEDAAAVNAYLQGRRKMQAVPLPPKPSPIADIDRMLEEMAAEIKRLSKISGDAVMATGPYGTVIGKADDGNT